MHKDFVPNNKLSEKTISHTIHAVFIIFLFIFIAALLLGGKWLWGSAQAMKTEYAVMKSEHEKLQEKIALLEQKIETQENTLNKLQDQATASKLKSVYTEAFYLTKNAIYQMRLHNLDATASLLDDALETLNSAGNSKPIVQSIKAQTSKIITLLKTTPKVDDGAIVDQINQLKQQIDSLPLALPKTLNSNTQTLSANQNSPVSSGLKAEWQQLKQLIIIRHYDKNVEPLMAPNQAIYLRQNLHLQLEQATLAVFYHNLKLYRLSLEKSQAWVKNFFDPGSKSTQIFLSQLNALLAIPLVQTTPKIESALNQILNKIQTLMNAPMENTPVSSKVCSIKPPSMNLTSTEEKF